MKIIVHKDYALANTGSRFLIYPLSTSFINNLDPVFMDRWMRGGWGVNNTVLLELRYMTIPAYDCPMGPASSLFSGVIYAWNANKYIKFIAFTKGYFSNIDEVNLKVDCWHEQRHLKSAEEYIYDGSMPPPEDTVAEEELMHVYLSMGEDAVEARDNHIMRSIEKNRYVDAIPGEVAVLWLREFFEDRVANYRSCSTTIPRNEYTTRMGKIHSRLRDSVAHFYQNVLRIDPRAILNHSLKP